MHKLEYTNLMSKTLRDSINSTETDCRRASTRRTDKESRHGTTKWDESDKEHANAVADDVTRNFSTQLG